MKTISDYIKSFNNTTKLRFKIKPEYLEMQIFDLENYIKFLSIKHSMKRKAEMVETIDVEYTLKKFGKPERFIKSHFKDEKTYIYIQQSIADSFLLLKRKFKSIKYPKILDAGCGWGRLLRRMRKDCYEDLEMFGIDIDDFSLRYGKTINKVDIFVKSDIQMLPFKDEIFDAAICNGIIHEVEKSEERYRAIQEIARVLKPNGLLYFHDIFSEFRIVRFFTRILRTLTPKVEWVLKRSKFEEMLLENGLKIIRMMRTRSHTLGIMINYQYIAIKS